MIIGKILVLLSFLRIIGSSFDKDKQNKYKLTINTAILPIPMVDLLPVILFLSSL